MANTRELSQLASLIIVNDETKSISILSGQPDAKLGVSSDSPTAKVDVGGDVNISGIVTATSFYGDGSNLSNIISGVGIQSAGATIGTGITTLNFIGVGNTFAINENTVDISIAGGGGSVSISTVAPENPNEGDLWYSPIYGRTFIYYEDADSSQWVDSAPFNSGILQSDNLEVDNLTVSNNANLNSLVVSGIVTATDFNSTSDSNLKENIRLIDNPIEKIMNLNGVSFNWKETQQPSIGVIAQEVEKVFPELVKENDDHKTVNYNGLIGVLIEVVKEQQKQIEELKNQINKNKAKE